MKRPTTRGKRAYLSELSRKLRPKKCVFCGKKLPRQRGRGRPRLYCNDRCRRDGHERRKHRGPMVLMAKDLSDAHLRQIAREAAQQLLIQYGFLKPNVPLPKPPAKQRRGHLHLVKADVEKKGDDEG